MTIITDIEWRVAEIVNSHSDFGEILDKENLIEELVEYINKLVVKEGDMKPKKKVKKLSKKLIKEIKAVKLIIKSIEKDFTKDKCKGYAPACANCQGQLLLGYLDMYLDLLNHL